MQHVVKICTPREDSHLLEPVIAVFPSSHTDKTAHRSHVRHHISVTWSVFDCFLRGRKRFTGLWREGSDSLSSIGWEQVETDESWPHVPSSPWERAEGRIPGRGKAFSIPHRPEHLRVTPHRSTRWIICDVAKVKVLLRNTHAKG